MAIKDCSLCILIQMPCTHTLYHLSLAQVYSELARRAFPGSPIACARFRKELLAPLRTRLELVESRMSAREFSAINYEAVPSKAMAK